MRARAEREITRGPGGNHRGLFSVWRARRAEARTGRAQSPGARRLRTKWSSVSAANSRTASRYGPVRPRIESAATGARATLRRTGRAVRRDHTPFASSPRPHLYSLDSLACSLRTPCPSYPKSRQRAGGSSLTPWGDGSPRWPFMSRACDGVFRMICRRASRGSALCTRSAVRSTCCSSSSPGRYCFTWECREVCASCPPIRRA